MNVRLTRIQGLVIALTALMALLAVCSGLVRPLGVVLGGLAAWLDFVVIRGLASAMLVHRPATAHIVPMALVKSVVLVSVPAAALVLPASAVDGVSFAIGVTALPASIVIDSCLALPRPQTGDV